MAPALQLSPAAQRARLQTAGAGGYGNEVDDGKPDRTDSTGGLNRHRIWTKRNGPVTGLAMEAAKAGQGLALISDVLAIDDITSGALVTPFNKWILVENEYRLAFPGWLGRDDAVLSFAAFIRAETQQHGERLNQARASTHTTSIPSADAELVNAP